MLLLAIELYKVRELACNILIVRVSISIQNYEKILRSTPVTY